MRITHGKYRTRNGRCVLIDTTTKMVAAGCFIGPSEPPESMHEPPTAWFSKDGTNLHDRELDLVERIEEPKI